MASETKLQIVIDAQNRTQAAFNGVSQNLDKVARDYSLLTSRMKTAGAIGAVAFAGLSLASKDIISAGADFEQTQIAFETMIGSAERANRLLSDLSSFAKTTPFQLTQIQEATKRLLAYGVGVEEVIPTLKSLGDISAGVGMDKLPQLILAFGQVKAATRLTGNELRQFSEAGVPLLDALSKQLNVSAADITTMVSNGEISFDQMQQALSSLSGEGGKFYELMNKQSASLSGQWSNLKDQISLTAIALGTALLPILKPIVEKLIEVATAVNNWATAHPQLAAAILTVTLVLTGLMALLLPIALIMPGLVLTFGLLGAAFTAVATVSGVLVIATIGALGLAIYKIIGIVNILKNDWDLIWLGIKTIAGNAANSVIDTVEGMVNFIISGVNKAIEAINKVIRLAQKVPGLGGVSTIKSISNVDFGSVDTSMMATDYNARNQPLSKNTPPIIITGNTLLDQDAAEKMGDLIMSRLRLSNAI